MPISVTSTVYDPVGRASKLVAHAPNGSGGETVQVTTYTYGVDSSFSSDIASMDLLRQVTYPDTKTVNYRYNRLGELKALIDQNGTQHDYTRDAAGRVTLDSATLASGSPIDNSVLGIKVEYDDAGRLKNAWSTSDAAGTTIVNAVRYDYNGLWQVTNLYQNHAGAITMDGSGNPTGTTQRVISTYSQSNSSSNNYSRPQYLYYPTQSRQSFSYSAGLNSRISRSHSTTFTNGYSGGSAYSFPIQYHDFIGLNMVSVMNYYLPDVTLDRTFSHEGKRRSDGFTTQAAGVYPGFDRFGRLQRQVWFDTSYMDVHASSTTVPAVPPIIEEVYTYDKNSNRTGKYDARPGVVQANRDAEYVYDQLNRLTEAKRGLRNGTTWTPAAGGQQWVLDMLGNWASIRTDLTGNGAYSDSGDLLDARTVGSVNQYTGRAINGGTSQPFAYDDAGNMTGDDAGRFYTHDAWNRLVKVTAGSGGGGGAVDLLRNQYNALHWRTVKQDWMGPSSTGIDRQTVMYYSAQWQLLEEHIDDNYNPTTPSVDWIFQEFWGQQYLDQPVMRRMISPADMVIGTFWFHLTDAQYSTLAMINWGQVTERVTYDAYGRARHQWNDDFNGDGATDLLDFDYLDNNLGTSIGGSGYDARLDLNRDGVVDSYDEAYGQPWFRNALPAGSLSYDGHDGGTNEPYMVDGPSNPFGYCGYVFNGPMTELYTVRFRHYSPELGRWLERDPAGYVDGMSLSEYAMGMPIGGIDAFGLSIRDDDKCSCSKNNSVPKETEQEKLTKALIHGIKGQIELARKGLEKGNLSDAEFEGQVARILAQLHNDISFNRQADEIVTALEDARNELIKEGVMTIVAGGAIKLVGTAFKASRAAILAGREAVEMTSAGARGSTLATQELIERAASKGGRGLVDQADAVRHLDRAGVNASEVAGNMFLRPDARKIEVLEEFLHHTQRKCGTLMAGADAARLAGGMKGYIFFLETHVKDFMIRHAKMLGLSSQDINVLKQMRTQYSEALKEAVR